MTGAIDQKLAELTIVLPQPAMPVASYVPYVITGTMVVISGQLPMQNGKLQYQGKLGAGIAAEQGQEAAQLCAINLLAQLKAACGGDLDKVKRVVRLGVFVNSTDEFTDQPKVANGASDLMVAVFGDKGKHARAAVGVNTLPFGVAVEVDAMFEI